MQFGIVIKFWSDRHNICGFIKLKRDIILYEL